jgi:hypothetical protein
MKTLTTKKSAPHDHSVPEWLWEVLIVVIVTPAVAHGLFAVGNFPIV